MSQPETALSIVARVRDALPDRIPLTVKLRRGMDDSPQSIENFHAIFEGAFRLGAAAITVHGRTVRQRYEGKSDWNFLSEVKRLAGSKTVLGSGDLFTAQDCLDMLVRTGVDGVSVARGAIGNPWIFARARALAEGRDISPPSLREQREVIAEHYRMAEQIYGPVRCGAIMRKFGIKYARLHPQGKEVRQAFIAVKKPGEWLPVLEKWYAGDSPGVWPTEVDDNFYSQ